MKTGDPDGRYCSATQTGKLKAEEPILACRIRMTADSQPEDYMHIITSGYQRKHGLGRGIGGSGWVEIQGGRY